VNDETEALLADVVARLEKSIEGHQCPAIVSMHGRRPLMLTAEEYLRDEASAAAFEHRAAHHGKQIDVTRWVLAVPQVWVMGAGKISARAVSNHPLREGEQEVIAWTAYDRDDGVDYGRVPYTRRPSGEPVFGEPELLNVGIHPAASSPGYILLRTIHEDD
jgi:hypothetical protein